LDILILHSELGVLRGGGENFSRSLFTAFENRGHDIAAAFVADLRGNYPIPLPCGIRPIPIAGWWAPDFGQAVLSTIARHFRAGTRPRKNLDRIQLAMAWRTFSWHNRRFQRRVQRRFSSHWSAFDAVYVHGDAVLASKVAQYLPTVLFLPGPVTQELAPELLATHTVCSNGDALIQIRSFLGDHATDLPVGLDHGIFKPGSSSIRQRLKWSAEDLVVGYVGRLHHIKGVDLLSTAFREISKRLPSARLLIIGRGEEEKNIRSDLADEIARGVVYIEPDVAHEDLPDWYRAMDLMVMPSRYENFSNALLEAMACEKPFLGSDIGGNRIMAATGAGWLFEPGSVSSLADRLVGILKNGSELKARGKAGSTYVQCHHSWLATAEHLERIITRIVKSGHEASVELITMDSDIQVDSLSVTCK
jgi:glycosyltransferase involved in cell wall biosynthesis